ncbi:hypothetical protein T12_15414 [Trichinella patagoniensis]|uniref:Uncharacterized protein n=1 Tax=Trichinella patagoniensis TaxID=990121 RepID=A0A0V0ZS70_9BILA|nr:hypothetical protein T12_15414 [Trichinella patagoniensis]
MALRVEVDAVMFIIGTSVVSLIIRLWIMSSYEARTDANQCSPGVSMSQLMALSNCVSYASGVFPCHARSREPDAELCKFKFSKKIPEGMPRA